MPPPEPCPFEGGLRGGGVVIGNAMGTELSERRVRVAGYVVCEIQGVKPVNADEQNVLDFRPVIVGRSSRVQGVGNHEQSEDQGEDSCKLFHGFCSWEKMSGRLTL